MDKPQRVIFRTFDDESKEVIAFLPDQDSNPGYVMSYMHIGQHAEADYLGLLQKTHLSSPEEFAPLKQEMERGGYVLDTKLKFTNNRIRRFNDD